MKHAFIFGTTIFLSEQRSLSLAYCTNHKEFLRVLSFYSTKAGFENGSLSIDTNISSPDGSPIGINNNRIEAGTGISIQTTGNRVKVYQTGHEEPILDVYQLDEHEYAGLSSHITNEIEVQHPDVVFTIKGNFKVNGTHFLIENEKMFVDNNGYANGVVNAHNGVILSAADAAY